MANKNKTSIKTNVPTNGSKLQLVGGTLLILSLFGIVGLVTNLVVRTLLGNPAVDTTGRAIVNIATLLSELLGIILGISFVLGGTIRKSKSKK